MRILAIVAALSLLTVTAASAQTPPAATTPQALSDVYACAQISDSAQRLACYDNAVGRLQQAETRGQVVAVDREQARTIERESFGFHLPSLSRILPNLEGGDREIDNIQMTVVGIRERAHGVHAFVMDDGQVWTQLEAQSVRNVRVGDTVTLQRAALASFRLVGSRGGAGHRVRREN
jgi:hypothetical protein